MNMTNDEKERLYIVAKNLFEEYHFLGLSEEMFIQNIVTKGISIYEENQGNIDLVYLKKELVKYLNQYLRQMLTSEETAHQVITSYLNENIVSDQRYSKNINHLNQLCTFLDFIHFYPTPQFYMDIISSNEELQKILKSVVQTNIDLIQKNEIDVIFKNQKVIDIIETYCMMNGIEIEENMVSNLNDLYDSFKGVQNLEYTVDSLKAYLREIDKPLLTLEDERELAIKMKKGDPIAKNIFIEANLKLVVSIAKKYTGYGLSFLDLIQEGNIGLIEAAQKYDISIGYRFSTYATYWIRQSILRAIADKSRNVRLPVHIHDIVYKYQKTCVQLQRQYNREPTIEEIAKAMGKSIPEVTKIIKLQTDTVSTNTTVDDTENEFGDILPDNHYRPDVIIEQNIFCEEVYDLLSKCQLTEREKDILILRYGLDGSQPLVYDKIGQIYHLTRERIRQIEAKALMKIRNSKYIKDFSIYMDNALQSEKNIDLYRENYYDQQNIKKNINKNTKSENHKKTNRQRKKSTNLYQFFSNFTEIEIDNALMQLPEKDMQLLYLRYGKNLKETDKNVRLTKHQKDQIYGSVLPKMKRLLRKQQ